VPSSGLVCVVEIPKGTRNKYEYDPELGGIKFDPAADERRELPDRLRLLRDTLAPDGDPLDALVCLYDRRFPDA
jgi:inorganic pyrophosphatase